MRYKIVLYQQSNKIKSAQLSRHLNGYKDYSNNGKYIYARKGLLNQIPNWNPIKGVFILEEQGEVKLVKMLEKYQATYHSFPIELNDEEMSQVRHR